MTKEFCKKLVSGAQGTWDKCVEKDGRLVKGWGTKAK